MTTTQSHLAEIRAKEARLTALSEAYPDLTLETDERSRRKLPCSKVINTLATDYDIQYSCGCCPDPALYLRVYVNTIHGRVYGVPYQIEIGEKDDIDIPFQDWESILREHGIHASLITRLQQYFENQLADQEQPDEALHSCAL